MKKTEKSVYELFCTMDYAEEITYSNKGKEWLKSYRKWDPYNNHVFCNKNTKNLEDIDHSSWKQILNNVLKSLTKNYELLAQILNETLYNSKDSKKVVSVFIKEFTYYFDNVDESAFYTDGDRNVDLDIGMRDIYLLGRLIGPLLITGSNIRINLLNEALLPYLVAIGDIITEVGVPKGCKYIFNSTNDSNPVFSNLVEISSNSTSYYCPMVIFEESDLDSALGCLIESSSRFNGKLYWSITHAYIQESIFDNFVCKLKVLSQRKNCIEIILCNQQDKLKCEKAIGKSKYFIGWDPRELEINQNLNMSVSLLPFRTVDEVVNLVNSQNSGCATSIWTEQLSIANRVSRLLKINTIWINSHGIIDPSVPFESTTETRLPMNGIQLLEFLFAFKYTPCNKKNITYSSSSTQIKSPFFRMSLVEAINTSKKGHEALKTLNNRNIQEFVDLFFNVNIVNVGMDSVNNISSSSDVIYHPSSKMDVICTSHSYQNILVILPFDTISVDIIVKVLYYLIATRNVTIICAPIGLLQNISDLIKPTLAEGIVTLLDINDFINCKKPSEQIGKILFISGFGKMIEKCGNHCLKSVMSCKKTVWMPTD